MELAAGVSEFVAQGVFRVAVRVENASACSAHADRAEGALRTLLSAHVALRVRGGAFVSLTYMASERVIPGYGGGMSSAKAALESDTRVLAFEAGRKWGHRVNVISAGPYASRAASAIGFIDQMIDYTRRNSPLAMRRTIWTDSRPRTAASASSLTGRASARTAT